MNTLHICFTMRELREKAGYTQTKVSCLLNIQRQTYCNYENALRTPPLEIIIALAELYHVSIDYLVRGAQTEEPKDRRTSRSTPPSCPAIQGFINDFVSLPDHAQKEVISFVQFKKFVHG